MKNKKPHIYIVMPVFNRLNFTKKCLASIFSQTYKNYTAIVVDDGSTDGTSDYISKKYPKVKLIKGDGNWWWTKSMHEGVKYALRTASSTDYVLEMNNDIYFANKYFARLIKTAKNYKNSMIGSLCVRSKNKNDVVEAGVRIDWPTGLVYGVAQTVSQKLSYYDKMNIIEDLDALPGKGTLIPIPIFKRIGNFDYIKLPHYIADYEFANRAKKHGFKLLVDPKAVIVHNWEATGISLRKNSGNITMNHAWNLLFGRKSMNNIIDWLNFIKLSCPPEYKFRNYYYSILKIIKALIHVKYFKFLLVIIKWINITLDSFHKSKLFLYRLLLKIIQFPEYHFKERGVSKK